MLRLYRQVYSFLQLSFCLKRKKTNKCSEKCTTLLYDTSKGARFPKRPKTVPSITRKNSKGLTLTVLWPDPDSIDRSLPWKPYSRRSAVTWWQLHPTNLWYKNSGIITGASWELFPEFLCHIFVILGPTTSSI